MHSRIQYKDVLSDLERYYGVHSSTIQRMSVFVIVWGMFEAELELTILTVTGEQLSKDSRPTTDAKQVSDLIKCLRNKSTQFEEAVRDVSGAICDAADSLLVIRNAMNHGWLVPSKRMGIGFINNPAWLNVKRKRETTEVFLSDQLLEKSIEAAAIIRECSMRLRLYFGEQGYPIEFVSEMASEVERAKHMAQRGRLK